MIKSFKEFYDAFIVELQSQRPDLTDVEQGSLNDVLAGVFSAALTEVTATMTDEFKKTFFATANGPEVTGSTDDLENLAVDHFGSRFARPEAVKATGTVQFSRANDDAGDCTISAGTIVKTAQSATGTSIRFETLSEIVMTATSISASVRAVVAGPSGNVEIGEVSQIETTLTDPSIEVTNAAAFAGGKVAENDEEYRETIKLLLETLKGGTLAALEATALTVGGVEFAKGVEFLQYAKEWDIGDEVTVGDYFGIPRAKIYIADANGTASDALIEEVQEAINESRAAGVLVDVIGATALEQNWSAQITLNPGGPNFAALSEDPELVRQIMSQYIEDLAIGDGLNRALAKIAVMAALGPAGTNDLTNFTTTVPSGDVSGVADQKIIPGTMSVV